MPVDRFFVETAFHEGELVELEGDEFHHLSRAIRKRLGETLELINGKGDLAEGTLSEMTKKTAIVSINKVSHQKKRERALILIQAIPRINRLDTILEKATELGCTAIHLFPGEYSERKELSSFSRLKKITESAIKQSGHLYLPKLTFFPNLLESIPNSSTLFFGDTDPAAPLLVNALDAKAPSIAIVIGPESGLSSKEEVLLKTRGAVGVKLADAILRTDTAPILALGLIAHMMLRE